MFNTKSTKHICVILKTGVGTFSNWYNHTHYLERQLNFIFTFEPWVGAKAQSKHGYDDILLIIAGC